jgi:4-hydroxy-tetrahydrodipicolinate synthase
MRGSSAVTTAKSTRRARYAQRAGADVVMAPPVSNGRLFGHVIFKYFLSLDDAIGIPIKDAQQPDH